MDPFPTTILFTSAFGNPLHNLFSYCIFLPSQNLLSMTGGAGMIAGRLGKDNWKGFADSATFADGPLRVVCVLVSIYFWVLGLRLFFGCSCPIFFIFRTAAAQGVNHDVTYNRGCHALPPMSIHASPPEPAALSPTYLLSPPPCRLHTCSCC